MITVHAPLSKNKQQKLLRRREEQRLQITTPAHETFPCPTCKVVCKSSNGLSRHRSAKHGYVSDDDGGGNGSEDSSRDDDVSDDLGPYDEDEEEDEITRWG